MESRQRQIARYLVNILLPFLSLVTFLSGQLIDIKRFNGNGVFRFVLMPLIITFQGPIIEEMIFVLPLTLQSARVLLDLNSFGLVEPLKQGVTLTRMVSLFAMLATVSIATHAQLLSVELAYIIR